MTQRKKFRIWTILVLGSTFVLVGTVLLINIIVDPYGILRTDFSRQFQVPNMNYIKMKYLSGGGTKFDSFIFGSSRVENIDQDKIANGIYYNMTYPLGLPEEHLANIRHLLDMGIPVKNVVIGIDEFSYLVDPLPRRSDLLSQPHPAVSGKNISQFYGEYFFRLRKIFPQLKAYIEHNYTKRNASPSSQIHYDMYETGRIFFRDLDEKIESNVKAHVQNPGFSTVIFDYDGDYVETALTVMRDITDLCRRNGINLTLFINPLHKTAYFKTDPVKMARFRRGLAAITDYYDFSGLNTITKNNYYYYETLHYRPMVGDMILKVLFGRPDVAVPPDFGSLVTRTNIEEHLSRICRELKPERMNMPEKSAAFALSCESASVVGKMSYK